MLKGLLLKESLNNLSILNTLQITKTETWNVQNAAANQPSTWTAISFEVDKNQADDLAEILSQSLKPAGWFINASTDSLIYVIFPSQVFKYDKGDKDQRFMAIEHGRSLGIPESQLDWNE